VSNNRKRNVHLHVLVTPEEMETIRERMAEAGVSNTGAYVRKMVLNGYNLNVDLSPVQELVSLQRKCSNNLNQIATRVNTYGSINQQQINTIQSDYTALWKPLSELLNQLATLVEL